MSVKREAFEQIGGCYVNMRMLVVEGLFCVTILVRAYTHYKSVLRDRKSVGVSLDFHSSHDGEEYRENGREERLDNGI